MPDKVSLLKSIHSILLFRDPLQLAFGGFTFFSSFFRGIFTTKHIKTCKYNIPSPSSVCSDLPTNAFRLAMDSGVRTWRCNRAISLLFTWWSVGRSGSRTRSLVTFKAAEENLVASSASFIVSSRSRSLPIVRLTNPHSTISFTGIVRPISCTTEKRDEKADYVIKRIPSLPAFHWPW